MVIDVGIVLLLVWMHFVSDFVFQSDYVAKNKSNSNLVLLQHVLIYGLPFYLFGALFAVVNVILHFIVDWCTSRITSKLWAAGKVHWFFVTIGFDQALHMSCLILTYIWLVQ